MRKEGFHIWRGITLAAVLLFSAAQTVEQSHFHAHADEMCVVCTHADGQDVSVPSTTEHTVQTFDVVRSIPHPSTARVVDLRAPKQSRAPPHFLS